MAQRFDASLSQISQWRRVGVPVHLLRDVAEWTHREVDVYDLLRDIEEHRARRRQAAEQVG